MEKWQRDMYCGDISTIHIGTKIVLNGWINKIRNFGDLIFIDLRDRSGLVQSVIDKNSNPDLITLVNGLKSEYVVSIVGQLPHS